MRVPERPDGLPRYVRRLGENAAPSAHIRSVRAAGRASCFILRAPERSGHPGRRHVRLRCRSRHRLMPTRSASPAVSGRRADFSGDQRQAAASKDTARPATRMSERCRSPQTRSRRRARPSATRSGCNGAGRSSRRTVTASRAIITPRAGCELRHHRVTAFAACALGASRRLSARCCSISRCFAFGLCLIEAVAICPGRYLAMMTGSRSL